MLARENGLNGVKPDDAALEYRMVHRDGRTVWIRDDAVLARGEDGELRWHGMLHDITDRKAVEAELERRAAQQAAVALLGEHALEGASTTDLMQEAVDWCRANAGAPRSRRCGSSCPTSTAWCCGAGSAGRTARSEGCAIRPARDPRRATRC